MEGLPPSMNQFYAGCHWAVRKGIADEWHKNFGWAFKASKLPQELPFPVELWVTLFCKGKVRDSDNAVTAAKFCGDALVQGKYLPDDSPEYVRAIRLESKKGKENKTVVIISPV